MCYFFAMWCWILLPLAVAMSEDECDSPGMMQLKGVPSRQGAQIAQPTSGHKFTPNVVAPKFEASSNESLSRLQMMCQGDNFLDCWNFFTTADPTHGYVQYVSKDEASQLGLFRVTQASSVYLGSLVGQNAPVKSIRLQSNSLFSEGHIFVIDIQHMPTGSGTWPAWWSYGPDWPKNGEIDTIETVNIEDVVHQTLHTSYGCFMNIPGIFDPNCNSNDAHNGCGLHGPSNSGGPAFNAADGGVFATKWTSEGIKMWVFPRSQIPQDLTDNEPDSSTWGNPWAFFPFGDNCPSTHFSDHVLVINLDFCGDWAGSVFDGGEQACEAFVKDPANIDSLKDAFWEINYVKVFAPEATMAKSKSKTKTMKSRESKNGKSDKKTKIKKNNKSKKSQKGDKNKSKKQRVSKTVV